MEDLRQYCIYYFAENMDDDVVDMHYKHFVHKSERTAYFEYVKRAHSLCADRIDEECSKKVMDALDFVTKGINGCVEDSFEGLDISKVDNKILREDQKDW